MKTILAIFMSVGFLGTWISLASMKTESPKFQTEKVSGIAIVELFTSEGCSSCPSADKVIAKIHEEYGGQPVYVLAYHVDYWDRLGWKDNYSNSSFSKRQYRYAEWLNLNSVYTPQVVVNGTNELVGSNETKIRSLISEKLNLSSLQKISLKFTGSSTEKINVELSIDKTITRTTALVSLVAKSGSSAVTRGENKGKKLAHVQIVLEQQSASCDKSTSHHFVLTIPKSFDKKNLELVAFLQNDKTGVISTATSIPVE